MFEGEHVFNVALTIFNDATEGLSYADMQSVDMRVALNTGRMKVVFIYNFIQDLLVNGFYFSF